MKKDLKNIVFGVLIAICIFVLVLKWLSLIFNYAAAPDLIEMNNSGKGAYVKTVQFMQWTSLTLFCLIVPTLLCFILSAFTKSKALNIMALCLGAAVVICCIIFIAIPSNYHHYGDGKIDAAAMTTIIGFWEDLITILIPSAILTGFSVARLVKGGKK